MELGQGSGNYSDRISSLPDKTLGNILSFLPTKHAVSTSILSKRWRYLFTLTHSLSFHLPPVCLPPPYSTENYEAAYAAYKATHAAHYRRFKEFVYNVLELHQISPIKKFSLVYHDSPESDSSAWLSTAVQKGVQELDCDVGPGFVLPDCVFVCETLVKLKLESYKGYQRETPLSVSLPNLKILHLRFVKDIDHDSLVGLFSGCPLLEELTLNCCTGCGAKISSGLLKVVTIATCNFQEGLEIDAPNLSSLTYRFNTNVKIVPSWKNSSSLVKAELNFIHANKPPYPCLNQYDSGLIKAAAYKTIYLRLMLDSLELLLSQADHEQMPEFNRLKILRIGRCPYYTRKTVTNLIDKSPQLKVVIFEWGLHYCVCVPSSPPGPLAILSGRTSCQCDCNPASLPQGVALLPFSCNARVIIVNGFCDHECSKLLVGHIMRNARFLKKLILSDSTHNYKPKEIPRLRKELLMLPRASPDCCIEFKLDTYSYVNSSSCMTSRVDTESFTRYRFSSAPENGT